MPCAKRRALSRKLFRAGTCAHAFCHVRWQRHPSQQPWPYTGYVRAGTGIQAQHLPAANLAPSRLPSPHARLSSVARIRSRSDNVIRRTVHPGRVGARRTHLKPGLHSVLSRVCRIVARRCPVARGETFVDRKMFQCMKAVTATSTQVNPAG
ncbi:hypothetical protein CRV24_007094 [Beauveria bassiana]|nr:hypothetical protein CRV24_007094 [Beauveria bassiana]